MSIVKIHGTSGAGKTTIVRNLIAQATGITAIGNRRKPEAYKLRIPGVYNDVYILGSYENMCGGMDTISSVEDQIKLIERYVPLGNVIYEGLLMSTYYGRLGEAMEQYGREHVWAFLDTPIDECIERVKARRREAGNTKPLNEANTRNRQRAIDALRSRLTNMGANVVDLTYDNDPTNQVWSLLK